MFLFAALYACADGFYIRGTVEDSKGLPWSSTIQVDIFAAEDVGVDGAVAYAGTFDPRFDFDVPAGDWVVMGAAGTCSGQSDVLSGEDGESVTTTVSMICVE
jgi:hypothetical protein